MEGHKDVPAGYGQPCAVHFGSRRNYVVIQRSIAARLRMTALRKVAVATSGACSGLLAASRPPPRSTPTVPLINAGPKRWIFHFACCRSCICRFYFKKLLSSFLFPSTIFSIFILPCLSLPISTPSSFFPLFSSLSPSRLLHSLSFLLSTPYLLLSPFSFFLLLYLPLYISHIYHVISFFYFPR